MQYYLLSLCIIPPTAVTCQFIRHDFFEGSYSEYEENKKKRLGDEEPKRFKYKKLME